EALVVRVAGSDPTNQPVAASATFGVLTATASSPGQWGDQIRIAVDQNTGNPGQSFNLTITLVDSNNPAVAKATEVWRNLTLTATDPNHAPAVVNAGSALVTLAASGTTVPTPTGTVSGDVSGALSGTLTGEDLTVNFGPGGSPPQIGSAVQLPSQPANL